MTRPAGRTLAAFMLAPLAPLALHASPASAFNPIAFLQGLPWAYALALAAGLPVWLLLRALRREQILPVSFLGTLSITLVGTAYQAWDLRRAVWVRQGRDDLVIDGQFTPEGLVALAQQAGQLAWLGLLGAFLWWLIARAGR